MGECAQYLLDNNYYLKDKNYALQAVISAISLSIRKNRPCKVLNNMTFLKVPGATTKQVGGKNSFQAKPIYCPELNIHFKSGVEAADYLIDNNIWVNIKKKTAKLRISDVANSKIKNYKGLSFQFE